MLVSITDLFHEKKKTEASKYPQKSDTVNINKKKVKEKTVPKNVSKAKVPTYDNALIVTLENDHKVMMSTFEKMMESAKEGNYLLLAHLLEDFTTLCANHIKKEDDELYMYLDHIIKTKSKAEVKVFSEYRFEMKNISTSIFNTINQNPNIPVSEDTAEAFISDFDVLGNVLKDRIEREERILYPIYANSRKVVNIS